MWLYSFLFSLLIFWLNLYFFSAFFPAWRVNFLLVAALMFAIFRGKIAWPLILLNALWESLILQDAVFGSILAAQIIVWLAIEALLKTLRPINTNLTVLFFLLASILIYSGSLKILSFFADGSVGVSFILLTAAANLLVALVSWFAINKITRATRKWLMLKF